ncbi:MAG: alpha/beta hydrolase [Hyphomicrobiales bacterium]|nr:alpha/beta hydrolase [Hyphomicrobiales bacterium]
MDDSQTDSDDGDRRDLPRDAWYTSHDGLKLHAADYGDINAPWLPVVCLHGLSRNARDFERLAAHLSTHQHRRRRVVAFDYRGRGRSDWDQDISNYTPLTEMADVLDGMAALGLSRAIIVGTSRGGIIAMLMGVARPNAIAGIVLNDIGPVIEPLGLARIKTYVGRTPTPDDWSDAVTILRRLHGAHFPGLSDDDWAAFAQMTYREKDGRPSGDYDPALAGTFDGVEFDRPVPDLSNEFRTLVNTPVLVIRGEHSDILSEQTVAEMAAIHPELESVTIDGQGHAPLLLRTPILQRISAFITGIEGTAAPVDAIVPRETAHSDPDEPTSVTDV